MDISRFSVKHPISSLVVCFTLLLFGIVAFFQLSLSLFPEIDYPTVTVILGYPNATPAEVEKLVVEPLEEILSSINGLQEIESTSQEGMAIVVLRFRWDIGRERLYLETREKLDAAKALFPKEVSRPVVLQHDPSSLPIMQWGIEIKDRTLWDNIRYYVRKNIVPQLEQIEGVGRVEMVGGEEKEVEIRVNLASLYAYGISLQDLIGVINYNNVDFPVGYVTEGNRELLLKVKGRIEDYTQLEEIVIGKGKNGGIVKIKDVAMVRMGKKEVTTRVLIGSGESLLLNIYVEGGKNVVVTSEKVRERVAEINRILAERLSLRLLSSQDTDVKSSLSNIMISAILGMGLAVLVLFFFLREWYLSFVVALIIPLSICITFFFMYLFGISFNIISMQGLALVVGMLVDSNIVVVENISRHLEMNHFDEMAKEKSFLKGIEEVRGSVINSILTNVAVFLPLVFSSGLAGVLFKELAMVVTIALFVSIYISLSFTPALLTLTYKKWGKTKRLKGWEIYNDLVTKYKAFLSTLMEKRRTNVFLIGLFTVVGIAGIFVFLGMKKEIFPSVSSDVVLIEYQLSPDISLDQNFLYARSFISHLESLSRELSLRMVYAVVGEKQFYTMGDEERENNKTKLWLCFTHEVSQQEIKKLGVIFRRIFPERTEFVVYREPLSLELLVPGSSILQRVVFSSENRLFLRDVSSDFVNFLWSNQLAAFVRKSVEEKMLYSIRLDREKISSYGLSPSQVSMMLNGFLMGNEAGIYYSGDEEIPIRVRGEKSEMSSIEFIKALPVAVQNGMVPLGMFLDITNYNSMKKLERKNRKNIVKVDFLPSREKTIKQVDKWLQEKFSSDILTFEKSWRDKEVVASMKQLFLLLSLSVVLIFLLLVFQFESFRDAFLILLAVFFVLPAIMILGWLGFSLNLNSMLGLILLTGVVVNNSIVLLEFYKQSFQSWPFQADISRVIIEASGIRLRPVLMTSLTTIFSLLPLAFGQGKGFDFQRPLTMTIAMGMLFSTLITLVVFPVLYFQIKRNEKKKDILL